MHILRKSIYIWPLIYIIYVHIDIFVYFYISYIFTVEHIYNAIVSKYCNNSLMSGFVAHKLNPLSANITKWSNTLKQFVSKFFVVFKSLFQCAFASSIVYFSMVVSKIWYNFCIAHYIGNLALVREAIKFIYTITTFFLCFFSPRLFLYFIY